jgi:Arc/MetJ family transcription regulator
LDVPEALLSDAMRACGAKTKRAAVLTALEELIRRGRMQSLARGLGNSETFVNSVELQAIRLREMPR